MRKPDYERRVVVTGLGVISSSRQRRRDRLGQPRRRRLRPRPDHQVRHDARTRPSSAGEVHDFNATDWMDAKAARRSEPSMHFGVAAAKQALADSGFEITDENRTEVGVVFGSGAGGQTLMIDNYVSLNERGPRTVAPTFIANALVDSCSGHDRHRDRRDRPQHVRRVGLRDRHPQRRRGGRGDPPGRLHRGHLRLHRGTPFRSGTCGLLEHARDGHAPARRGRRRPSPGRST